MAMLDPYAPIPYRHRQKIKKTRHFLNQKTKEIVYPIEKVSFLDKGIDTIYYTVISFEILYDKKPTLIIKKNKYELFSNDSYIIYFPHGDLITNNDIKEINLSLIQTKNIISIINVKKRKKRTINLFKKIKEIIYN
jgi:hypothetical protein